MIQEGHGDSRYSNRSLKRGRELGKDSSMEYALFTLMWLAVALLAVLGVRIAIGVIFDLRERLGRR